MDGDKCRQKNNVTWIGSSVRQRDLLQTNYYSRLFINDWRPNPGCIYRSWSHSAPPTGPVAADEETDFLWLMKIPSHVRPFVGRPVMQIERAETCVGLAGISVIVGSCTASSCSKHWPLWRHRACSDYDPEHTSYNSAIVINLQSTAPLYWPGHYLVSDITCVAKMKLELCLPDSNSFHFFA